MRSLTKARLMDMAVHFEEGARELRFLIREGVSDAWAAERAAEVMEDVLRKLMPSSFVRIARDANQTNGEVK